MRKVTIAWCGDPAMPLGRLVLDPGLEAAPELRAQAERLGVPVVEGQTELLANDLWVGISPTNGWGGLAGVTMWARSAEAPIVVDRLAAARVYG